MTALSIIALQGQVAALELAVAGINTTLGLIDIEIGSSQSQTFFLRSNSTPFGVPTEVNTGGPRTRIKSSLTVYDLNQNALTNIDWLNSTVSIEGAFNVSYSNKIVLTADTGAINAYVPLKMNGVFTQNGKLASMVNIPSTGNINCYSGLSITNENSNKIIQSYKCNTSNLNLFNTYDAQIVSVGNSSSAFSSNNTGSIYLNSYNTFLCSDVDTNPTKYIVYNNLANVYYKTNPSGTYLADATVSIQPGSDNTTRNEGIYYINCGLFSPKSNMVQQGSYCTQVNQLSNASNSNFDFFNVPYSFIQHNNSNLSTNNTVSTYYKADTTRNNTSDATISVYQNPGVGTFENKGRMRLDDTTFEPSCNIIQTGSSCKTVSITTGTSFVNSFNSYDATADNIVGTRFKADPTNASTVSDASITVTPAPLTSMYTIAPSNDYGTLSVNAQSIYLGNKSSTISIPGTLVTTYVDTAHVSHQISVGQFLSQMRRTRL